MFGVSTLPYSKRPCARPPPSRYTHDAQCLNWKRGDPNFIGKELCFCYNEDSLTIVDVSDKSNIKMISRSEYSLSAYTHQGWLLSDNGHLLMNE
jgi:hypothetical protein